MNQSGASVKKKHGQWSHCYFVLFWAKSYGDGVQDLILMGVFSNSCYSRLLDMSFDRKVDENWGGAIPTP